LTLKIWVLCLALGVVPAFGGSRQAPVRLYIEFQHDPPDVVLEALQTELETVMQPSGMDLEWRWLANAQGNEVSTELVVIHFKGRCDLEEIEPVAGFPGPLGWTHISEGEVLPFIDVNCDGVRLFLQQDLVRFQEADRSAAYGRALGRVLAHELYHVFTRSTKHGSSGIAKAAYTVKELLSDRFDFAPKQCDVLRAHQLRLLSEAAAAGQ
jgi:hypothetical protein